MSDADRLRTPFGDLERAHSDFQIDNFIVAKNGAGTEWGRYKQALRELHKRWRGLKQLELDERRLAVDVDEAKKDLTLERTKDEPDAYAIRRLEIDLLEHAMHAEDLTQGRGEQEREFGRFFAIASALKESIGEVTPAKRAAMERDFWTASLRAQALLDLATAGRVSQGVAGAVAALPPTERAAVIGSLGSGRDAFDVLMAEGCDAPALELERDVDVAALLEGET